MSADISVHGLSYSLRRFFVDRFYNREVSKLPAGCFILDVGGNKIGKRGAFNIESFEQRVIYVNLSSQKRPDLIADAAELPFCSNAFDVVICSELLEHVKNPREALAESLRVLKPNGVLLATIPFMYPQHPDPVDYGRYTEQYLFDELHSLGFGSISVERQGGFWCVLIDMLRAIAYEWRVNPQMTNFVSRAVLNGKMIDWLKTKALNWDESDYMYHTVYCKGVTTGFGVKANKPPF